MKLKPQPPVRRRGTAASRPKRRGLRLGRRDGGRQASRPTTPLRRRLSARLPSIRRVLAGVAAVALVSILVALIGGPWLRVRALGWEGLHYTTAVELEQILAGVRGQSALAVDTRGLSARLAALPAVAEAVVEVSLTGRVEATIVEREAAFVWETRHRRFIGAADGTLFARLPDDTNPPALGDLPSVVDMRSAGRVLRVGDVISPALVRVSLRLAGLDPVALGSSATQLHIEVDDEHGFLLSSDAEWQIVFGVYGLDPNETPGEADARLDRQVTAVRTLFATRPEAELAWVDVRNPGKVYFRARG